MNTIKRYFTQHFTPSEGKLLLLMLLTPVTAFYLMQFAYSGSLPWDYPAGILLANYLCIGAVHFTLCALTNYIVLCCFVTHLLCFLWGTANYYVSLFRGTPILPWDFTALGTAAAVADSYQFSISRQMGISLILLALLFLLLRRRMKSGRFRPSKNRLRARAAYLCAIVACAYPVLQPNALETFGVRTDVWDQSGSYSKDGALAVFLRNTQFMSVEPPQDPSAQNVQRIAQQVAPVEPAVSTDTRPNIIAIMNESWADFESFGNLSLSESVTDFIDSLGNCIRGHCYTSVFGAGTSASEFEFLTGNSMAFLPTGSVPYQQYIKSETPSLASYLKSLGYTTTAIHPYNRSGWDRDTVYGYFGFDQFLDKDSFTDPYRLRGYISDKSAFDKIIEQYEIGKNQGSQFIFEVTMQNHGGYSKETPDFNIYLTLPEIESKTTSVVATEKYLTLINQTDRALQELVEYFEQQSEPTIIVMFGDHQPSDYITNTIQRICGVTGDDTLDSLEQGYRVPFLMWSNYGLEHQYYDGISVNYLSSILMQNANIAKTGYQEFLSNLMQSFPIINANVYQDADGVFHSWDENQEEQLKNYQILQYNQLVDKKHRDWSFFGGNAGS